MNHKGVVAIGILAVATLAVGVVIGGQALAQEPTPTPVVEDQNLEEAMQEACEAGDIDAMVDVMETALEEHCGGSGDAHIDDMHGEEADHHPGMHGDGDTRHTGMMGH